MNSPLRLVFQYKCTGKLWRILWANEGSRMLIEQRDENSRTLSFIIINLPFNKNERPEAKNPGIDWYGGLAAVHGDLLVFHLERAQNSPVFKGIAVGSLDQLLWSHSGYSFQNLRGSNLEVLDEAGQSHSLSLESGELIENHQSALGKEIRDERLFPEHYPQGHAYFEEVASFLHQHHETEAHLSVDYMEWKHYLLIAWYEKKSSGYLHHLTVFEASGSIVDKFILASDRQGIGRDTFFVANDYLFMVCENTELKVYQ